VTETGWSSNDHGLSWLKEFDKEISESAGYSPRLLLVDGYGSHITEGFIKYAISKRIWLAVFPPHATHILQPLDVAVFAPLSIAYSDALDDHILRNRGMLAMNKRLFFRLFWPSWDKAVSIANITSGFEQSRIYPYNPSIVIDPLLRQQKAIKERFQDTTQAAAPIDRPIDIKRLIKAAKIAPPTRRLVVQLCDTIEHLSTAHDLMKHDIAQLRITLGQVRPKTKPRQPLGLSNDNNPKHGQFFTPHRIQQRKDVLTAAAQAKDARKLASRNKKKLQKVARQYKLQQVELAKRKRLLQRISRLEEEVERKTMVQGRRDKRAALLQGKIPRKKAIKKPPTQPQVMEDLNVMMSGALRVPAAEATQSRIGRTIQRPLRFRTPE
jgi:hypothetical protein